MKNTQKGSVEVIIITLIALIVLSMVVVSPIIAYTTDSNVTFTVKNKENIVSNNNNKYLIFTDNGVYENSDSLWYWKWNSSDVYNDIEIGKTYEATVYGFRVPFLSMYKNIVSVQ